MSKMRVALASSRIYFELEDLLRHIKKEIKINKTF